MSKQMEEAVQCPICFDTLKKPIRILTCGHNLCHSCLVALCNSKAQKKCPACREVINLGPNGVEGLPRCYALENMVEIMNNTAAQAEVPQSSASQLPAEHRRSVELFNVEDGHKRVTETSTTTTAKNHKRAYEVNNEISRSIKKVQRLLNLEKFEEAELVCVELISVIEASAFEDAASIKETFDGCDEEIKKFAEAFLEKEQCNIGIGLANSLFKLIKCMRQGKDKLIKLKQLGSLLQNIALEMSKQDRAFEFKPQIQTMNEILKEMQNIIDVDKNTRCLQVTYFLYHFGLVYISLNEYQNFFKFNNEAINGMLSVFGNEAYKYRVLGLCFNNSGIAYEETNQLIDAKASYAKAIDVYRSATDYANNEERNKTITFALKFLHRVDQKLQKC